MLVGGTNVEPALSAVLVVSTRGLRQLTGRLTMVYMTPVFQIRIRYCRSSRIRIRNMIQIRLRIRVYKIKKNMFYFLTENPLRMEHILIHEKIEVSAQIAGVWTEHALVS